MEQDPNKPVAYDAEGRPLYAAPQVVPASQPSSHVTAASNVDAEGQGYNPGLRVQEANEPEVVHATRPVEPPAIPLSDEVKRRYEESRLAYPHLNLSEGEFVILDIKRHPIGLILPILTTGVVLLALSVIFMVYPSSGNSLGLSIPSFSSIVPILLLLMLLVGLGGFVAVWVYMQNRFYLTNESVVQEIQHSLFSRHEQTVSLGSIEDASYRQTGIVQTMFNYGSIRLSTEGEETTYRFAFVTNPRRQVAILNNAIEAFKNGRPVDMYEN